jgi:hypothetical protein
MRASDLSTPCSMGAANATCSLPTKRLHQLLDLVLETGISETTQEKEDEVPAERKLGSSPCSKTDLTQNF